MGGAVSRGCLGAHTHICQHTNVHIRVGARRHGLEISCRMSGADERERVVLATGLYLLYTAMPCANDLCKRDEWISTRTRKKWGVRGAHTAAVATELEEVEPVDRRRN